jgi:hypothetical protein
MQFMVIENKGKMILWGEPEEDGVKFFLLEEVKEGEKFFGEIPYDELKKFAPGMVDIDPDTFQITAVKVDS